MQAQLSNILKCHCPTFTIKNEYDVCVCVGGRERVCVCKNAHSDIMMIMIMIKSKFIRERSSQKTCLIMAHAAPRID